MFWLVFWLGFFAGATAGLAFFTVLAVLRRNAKTEKRILGYWETNENINWAKAQGLQRIADALEKKK